MEVPRLGVKLELQLCQIRGASANYTTAHSNAGSFIHWARPGIEPTTLWFLVRFVSAVPQWELLCIALHYSSYICHNSSVKLSGPWDYYLQTYPKIIASISSLNRKETIKPLSLFTSHVLQQCFFFFVPFFEPSLEYKRQNEKPDNSLLCLSWNAKVFSGSGLISPHFSIFLYLIYL